MMRVAIKYLPMVNSVRMPPPRQLKRGASLALRGGEGRANVFLRDPMLLRGKVGLYGFNTEAYGPVAFASNQHNEEQALNARVLADTVSPNNADLTRCILWCKWQHKVLFPHMKSIKPVSFDDYIRRSNASPSVKKTLIRTMKELESEGIDQYSTLDKVQCKLWTTRSSFVKVENNLYSSPMGVKEKAPRLIQGAQPQFICLVGPWIMACQDLLKRRWGTGNNLCFTSGLSSEKTADYISSKHGRIVEDDLGKFDCSIRKAWCDYEVWLCERWGAPRAVLQLMTANIMTHGNTLHGWKYKCEGTRKSGDPYTSLMNSIINGLSHLFLYCEWTGKTAIEARKSIWMLLQGDDNLLRHLESGECPWQQGMASLGFDSEAIYRDRLETAEFCSNRLYRTTRGYLFGPKPGKVLAKLGYIVTPPNHVSRESLMRGVALGLRQNCNFIPPIRCVIDRILEITEGAKAYYQRGYLDHVIQVRGLYEATDDVKVALYDQYYWDNSMQASFEKTVKSLRLGDAYSDSYADLLFDRDTSAPQRIFNNVPYN